METSTSSDESDTEIYLKLLQDFKALPPSNRTFMEVSGYPHYENVCSNILAFYFDPNAEHRLRDLFISAFLHMAGKEVLTTDENSVEVYREYGTENRNRIDLVIDSDAFTIGIENKIYHWVANDLEHYGKVIDDLGQNKVLVKAVLAPSKNKGEPLKGGFEWYTYSKLWDHVRPMLSHYSSNPDSKWVIYLNEFMQTITDLAGENMEVKQVDRFFTKNYEDIEKMFAARKLFLDRLNQKVSALCAMMKDAATSGDPKVWGLHQGRLACLCLTFTFEGPYSVVFDLWPKPAGWELHLFGRDEQNHAYVRQLISRHPLQERTSSPLFKGENKEKQFIVQSWPIDADLGEIRDDLCSWILALSKAASQAN